MADDDVVLDRNVEIDAEDGRGAELFAFENSDTAFDAAGRGSCVRNDVVLELGGVACGKTPRCDGWCPWRHWWHAYETGEFTAFDVPTQPSLEGSRRQFRGPIVRLLGVHDEMSPDTFGHRICVGYTPDGGHGREWLQVLLSD